MFIALIIVLILIVAFFHYIQGLFSATLSAFFAIIAAMISLGYHEYVVDRFLGGKYADSAHAWMLGAIFAVAYIIPRGLFDKYIPGNVRFHPLADKIGAGVMGAVAGVFATGVLAVAAQSLPMGPSIGGYARFVIDFGEKVVLAPPGKQQQDREYDKVNDPKAFTDPAGKGEGLLLPVDDITLGLFNTVAGEHGSLAGARAFAKDHPDYLKELFGQRIGLEPGANRTVLRSWVSIDGLFVVPPPPAPLIVDVEATGIRRRGGKLDPLRFTAAERLLIVRATIAAGAADKDAYFRVGPGGVRIVRNGINYFPVGTIYYTPRGIPVLYQHRIDDFIITSAGQGIDFAFKVEALDFVAAGQPKLANDVFFEIKRMGRVDISGKDVSLVLTPSDKVIGLYKSGPATQPHAALPVPTPPRNTTPTPPTPPTDTGTPVTPPVTPPAAAALQVLAQSTVGPKLPAPVGLATEDKDTSQLLGFGTLSLKGGLLSSADIDAADIAEMGKDARKVTDFFVPAGKALYEVRLVPPATDTWGWTGKLDQFELETGADKARVKPAGVWIKNASGQKVTIRFESEAAVAKIAAPKEAAGEVGLIFIGSSAAPAAAGTLYFEGKPVAVKP